MTGEAIFYTIGALIMLIAIIFAFRAIKKSRQPPPTAGTSGGAGAPPAPPPTTKKGKVPGQGFLIVLGVVGLGLLVYNQASQALRAWDQYSASTPMTMSIATHPKNQARFLNLKPGADWVNLPNKNPENFMEVLGWKEDDGVETMVRFEPSGRKAVSSRYNLVGTPEGTKTVSFKLTSLPSGATTGQLFVYYQQPR